VAQIKTFWLFVQVLMKTELTSWSFISFRVLIFSYVQFCQFQSSDWL